MSILIGFILPCEYKISEPILDAAESNMDFSEHGHIESRIKIFHNEVKSPEYENLRNTCY